MKTLNFIVNRICANTPPCCSKRASRFVWVLVLMLTLGVGQMWGTTYTWDLPFSTTTNDSKGDHNSTTGVGLIVKTSTGSNANGTYTHRTETGSHFNMAQNGYYLINVPITSATTSFTLAAEIYGWKQGKYVERGCSITYYTSQNSTAVNVCSGTTTTSGCYSADESITIPNNYKPTSSGTLYIKIIATAAGNLGFESLSITTTDGSSCSNKVTISAGTNTNCTFTLTPNGQQESCDGVATTVSITPTPGYGNPTVTQSGASKTPTISGTGNTKTITYQANTTGTSTINVSCSANTYTITLNKDLTPTTAGTESITATYNSNDNLTSAITTPTKTGWTFAGYYTAKNGGGTQIIDADGNVKANVSNYTDSNKKWIKADNVTLYAKWTRTVTWSVNRLTNVYPASTVTYNATASKVASIPTAPNPASYCGDKFVGWTTDAEYVHRTSPLFTTAADSPDLNSITADVIFYAVFADYDE